MKTTRASQLARASVVRWATIGSVAGFGVTLASCGDAPTAPAAQHSALVTAAATGSFELAVFPLSGVTLGSETITAVFDHSVGAEYATYCADGVVMAYTGEMGSGARSTRWFPAGNRCSTPRLFGLANEFGRPFSIGGRYQSDAGNAYLYYDGHPGYDYETRALCPDGIVSADCPTGRPGRRLVLAAADGVVMGVLGADAQYGRVRVAHPGAGYQTWYMHLDVIFDRFRRQGTPVAGGEAIGISGTRSPTPIDPHLHFEVRQCPTRLDARCGIDGAIPVDPYGWAPQDPSLVDPYPSHRVTNRNLWAPAAIPFIPMNGRFVRGIAYEFGVLWAVHSEAGGNGNVVRISRIDPTSGVVLAESGDFGWNGRGITVADGSLWIADAFADRVHRVDPSDFSVLGSFSTPGTEPNGITFDATSLWLGDPFFQRMYQLSLTGQVISSFPIPNAFRNGLEWDASGMWTTTAATELTHYLPNGSVSTTTTLQGLPSGTFVYDIAIGGGRVFVSAGDRIHALVLQLTPG